MSTLLLQFASFEDFVACRAYFTRYRIPLSVFGDDASISASAEAPER